METLHARYPFFDAARQAVDAAGVDLGALVAEEDAVVERALERVESAITDGAVGDPHRSNRIELLSYPVARIVVSVVDEAVLTHKYARAEAATARGRIVADCEAEDSLSASTYDPPDLDRFVREFDLDGDVREIDGGYEIGVGRYLTLAADAWGDEWRLVNRQLHGGRVPVDREELYTLLQQAVRRRVERGLPLSVPEEIATLLDAEIEHLREQLAELELTREIDTVVPDLFPPCMKALLDRIQKGEHLDHHSRFAVTAFLTSIGMSTDDIVDIYMVNEGFGEEMTRYQTDHIRGESGPTEYSPPSCATMQSYGDCVNMDDRCETISHPLGYYEKAIDDADEDELTDWRETTDA